MATQVSAIQVISAQVDPRVDEAAKKNLKAMQVTNVIYYIPHRTAPYQVRP